MTRLLITFWLLHQFHIEHFPATCNISHFLFKGRLLKYSQNQTWDYCPRLQSQTQDFKLLKSAQKAKIEVKVPLNCLELWIKHEIHGYSATLCSHSSSHWVWEPWKWTRKKIKGSLSREVWVSKPSHLSDSCSPRGDEWETSGNSGVFLLTGKTAPFFSSTELPSLTCASIEVQCCDV